MENILAVPPRDHEELLIPTATVLHGSNNAKEDIQAFMDTNVGNMQLHGARLHSASCGQAGLPTQKHCLCRDESPDTTN